MGMGSILPRRSSFVHGALYAVLLSVSPLVNALNIEDIQDQLPEGSQLALSIYDPEKKTFLHNQLQRTLLAPASTQKLFTALATKLYLPPEFTFSTSLHYNNEDLTFTFNGDPTFMRRDLKSMLQGLKERKVRKITGDIWLDDSIFEGHEHAIGLPWDILGICYSAPSTAITLENNCVQASLYSNKKPARLFVPRHQPITYMANVDIVTEVEQKAKHCDLDLNYHENNRYVLSGCIKQRNTPLPLKFAIQDPTTYFSDVLRSELEFAGISFNGEIKQGEPKKKGHLVNTHHSEPRDKLLATLLIESDNLIADNLLKTLGHKYFKQPGSFNNGIAALKKIILDKTDIDLTHSVIADGSGLSRNNRMTAEQLMLLLQWVNTHDVKFFDLLPQSGINGTLKYRRSFLTPSLKNKLRVKTGSLFGSHNLAGILTTNNGKKLLIVQLVSGYYVPPEDMEENTPSPIQTFERKLYNTLISTRLAK